MSGRASPSTSLRGGAPAKERELRAQGRKTMQRLLEAGMEVFKKRGYHAARVDDIVKLAKTSHGTFYLYFANKEDLFRALATDVADRALVLSESLGPISADTAGWKDLREWLDSFSQLYFEYGPVIRAWTEAELPLDEFGQMGTELMTGFTRSLAKSMLQSGPTPGVDARVAATAFLAMIERFNYYLLSRQIDFPTDDMLDTITTILHIGIYGGRPNGRGARRG